MKSHLYITALLLTLSIRAEAGPTGEKICAFAPSQSKAMAALAGSAGGSAAAIAAVGQAAGLTDVAHSSGAAILTGSGGYVAGTLGAAAAAPAIVTVGLVVGGTAVAIELVCSSRNHPEQVAKIEAAAVVFSERSKVFWNSAKSTVVPRVSAVSVSVKQVSGNVLAYAYRKVGTAR